MSGGSIPPKRGFAPVVDERTRVLLLGSLPGDASLAAERYYGHPRNLFWRLVGDAIGEPLEPLTYDERLAALRRHQIGLWDVFASARRQGSLDAAIRDAQPAALDELAASLPELAAIGFNGKAAARAGRAALDSAPYALIDLPSSSPAYAAMDTAEKQARWNALRPFLVR